MNKSFASCQIRPAPARWWVTFLLLAGAAGLSAQTTAPSAPAAQEVVMLEEFNVTTKPDNSYLATESTSGTRVATPIVNLPYSVQVLTEDFFKDFQLYDLDEMVPFVALRPTTSSVGSKGLGNRSVTIGPGLFSPQEKRGCLNRCSFQKKFTSRS